MKSKAKKSGFSIIELLTVMSIIIILLGILVPSLGAVRRYARVVRQKGYFHEISKGLEMFSVDFDGYPDSFWKDTPGDLPGQPYCGAMKLCEAMIGQDGLGFHPDSVFDAMGFAADGTTQLYFNRSPGLTDPPTAVEEQNLRGRKPLYVEGEDVQIASVENLFGTDIGQFDPCCPVLCDVFKRNQLRVRGEKAGMPILYYKADPSKILHDFDEMPEWPDAGPNIYNYWDNVELISIELPWQRGEFHPLFLTDGEIFYEYTTDKSVPTMKKPHNPDSYILISAGWDGLYGTEDDVFNFD